MIVLMRNDVFENYKIFVTIDDESDIVFVGKAVYDSWQETLYLSKEYQIIRRAMWIANHFVLNTKICFAKYDRMLYHYVAYCKKFLN
ncbi:hypothetical protein AA988_01175 [Enterococcus cecorum]|nr:hypothetical protein AA988_01175 [Enterococcus cecorum]